MCEVLPTIDETSPSPDGENSRLEQLMITMLEERDQLMEKLRESQESYNEATKKLSDVEADNSVLMRQLQALMPEEEDRLHSLLDEIRSSGGMISGSPEDMKKWPVAKKFAVLARDLASVKERMSEREEEVQELKSERANTRLLLEHLECLVARHERSLRMTVVKRQTTNTGVSSEVEVLKALKSLFDHHKALDEKVRERLRSAQERNVILEDELMLANQEIKSLHDRNKAMKRQIQQRNSVRLSMCYDNISFTKEQLALLEDRDVTIGDLQFGLDEKDAQLEEAIHLRDELAEKLQEVEDELAMALKELQREQHTLKINSKQINELVSSRSKLDARVSELQTQLTETQLQLSKTRDQKEQLGNQLITMEAKLVKVEEEAVSVRAEVKQKEALLQQSQTLNEALQQRQDEQLSEVEQWSHAQHKIKQLEAQLETKDHELIATQEKERVNEGHISRLQLTIERMLRESDERMKTHYNERKSLSDEKSSLQQRVESLCQEVSLSRQQNQELQKEVERLKERLEKRADTSTASSSSHPRSNKLRYSWQITNLDDALSHQTTPAEQMPAAAVEPSDKNTEEKPDEVPSVGEGVKGEDDGVGVWDLGEPGAVSKLVSMLEGQVSKLDKQLENMGDNAQADEFDQLLQKMTEGTYQPPDLEALPLSSPPGSRPSSGLKNRPAAFDTFPKSLYQVNLSGSSPLASPASSTASTGSNGSSPNTSSKHKPLRHRGSFSKLFRRKDRGSGHKKNSARRASAPIPRPTLRNGDTGANRDTVDFGDLFSSAADSEEDKKRKSELLNEVLERGTPFAAWDSSMVLAWLEVWVGVPIWYIGAIRNCVHSGAMLSNITEAELGQELGITNTLHRLKLRLAVQEIVTLTSSANPQLARTTSLYGEMGHDWISDYWLPSLGLSQYKDCHISCWVFNHNNKLLEVFRVCLVDARMLEHLTKKDLRTVLKMVDSAHRNSLQYGISVLKKVDYNRSVLEERREAISVESRKDVLVWTNDHVISWVESIGLSEYAPNLKESSVHGGSIALDSDFDCEKLALALKISPAILEVQRKLKVEFGNLLTEGTSRATTESQSHGKIVRKLSKKLRVSSRKVTPPVATEFMPIRSTSPVLYSSNPAPLHQDSILGDTSILSTNSLPVHSNSIGILGPLDVLTELNV